MEKPRKKESCRLSNRSQTADWVTASAPVSSRIAAIPWARRNTAAPNAAASRPMPICQSIVRLPSGTA